MKVLHIIPSISQDTGGPSRSCQGLIAELCRAGVDAWYYGFRGVEPWFAGVRSFKPVGAELTVEDVKQFDLVHLHSVWLWPMHKAAKLCRQAGVKYVVAPRGMLEPWSLKQKWLKKKIAWWLYLRNDLKKAAALHATAASEEQQFRALGLEQKVIVSPNGVNLPEGTSVGSSSSGASAEYSASLARTSEPPSRRALFMSRMHVKKGVRELIEAWRRVSHEGWTLELVYTVRNEEERAYEAKCKELAGGDKSIIFTGALDDEKKWEAYGRADLFVLPTYSENFGIVVAEALWSGVPVITTKGTPWSELESEGCGWWIDTGVDALARTLKECFVLSDECLAEMGRRGHDLVERKYTWPAIGRKMVKEYEDILRK